MKIVKDVTICTFIGFGLVTIASAGIYCATLGMCALASLGVILE